MGPSKVDALFYFFRKKKEFPKYIEEIENQQI